MDPQSINLAAATLDRSSKTGQITLFPQFVGVVGEALESKPISDAGIAVKMSRSVEHSHCRDKPRQAAG